MALAIDASTPAVAAAAANVATITSNAFSPPAGSAIFALFAHDGAASVTQTVTSLTDSLGSHLTWNPVQVDNVSSASIGGLAGIYWAYCPTAQASMTVAVNFSAAGSGTASPDGSLLPIVFTGAASSQAGASARRNSTATGTPSLSVAGTASGSWVIGVVQNFTNATGPTVPAGQSTTINAQSAVLLNATDLDSYWVQVQSAASNGGVVTINDTAPTAIEHHMVIVEVQAASGARFTPRALPSGV